MKITHIEMIPIAMPLARRYGDHHGRMRMYDIDQHLVVKVHADNGLVGYGDYEDNPNPVPKPVIDSLIGRDPFDFIHNNFHLALGMALYDVMGKHLGVPAYKLMGQKVRDAAPVAAWTRPCPPEVFREEIRRAADQGYTIFKMHSDARFDVIEQTRAAEEVAPPGFKIHWDFNHNRTLGTVLPIIAELERDHPIVGFIEDPLVWSDIDGWRTLRQKTRIPLVMHVPQLGGLQEVIRGVADIYMIGGGIGDTLISGFAYGKANMQVIIQQSGNTLMKALSLHQAAVLPAASAHLITLDDQYDEDITAARIPVIAGSSPVPEGPGLLRTQHGDNEGAIHSVLEDDANLVEHPVGAQVVVVELRLDQLGFRAAFLAESHATGHLQLPAPLQPDILAAVVLVVGALQIGRKPLIGDNGATNVLDVEH